MSLVAARCPNCGANVEVDPSTDAGICTHCGSAFVTQKAIINYNSTIVNNNNIYAQNVNIVANDFDSVFQTAMESYQLGDYKTALEHFKRASEINSNHIDCKIYKALCSDWVASKVNTSPALYKLLFLDNDFNGNACLNTYIKEINKLLARFSKLAYSQQDPEYCNPSLIISINTTLRKCVNGFKTVIDIISKYDLDKKKYLTVFKNYSIALSYLIAQKTWCTHLTGGVIDYKKITVDDADSLTKILKKNNEIIKKIDPTYHPPIVGGGCYVATCVYGSYDCPQVWTLRRYRDYRLSKTWYGRAFIHLYYAVSPTIVKLFGNTEWFKIMWKGKLDKMVNNLQREGFEDTPYDDIKW